MSDNFQRRTAYAPGTEGLQHAADAFFGTVHLDGIPWDELPPPPRWHHCQVQTRSNSTERCACGAIRWRGRQKQTWMHRNDRRGPLLRWWRR